MVIYITNHTKKIGMMAVLAVLCLGVCYSAVATSDNAEGATSYKISYDVGATSYQFTYFVDETTLMTLGELGAAVPSGQEFKGWSLGGTTIAPGSTVSLSASAITTVTAVFADIIYKVEFKDGTKTIETFTGKAGTAITIPSLEDTKTHLFGGWTPEPATTITGNVTYVAVWNQIWKVSWVVEGAVIASGDMLELNKPVDPVKDHFTFGGWKDAKGAAYTAAYRFSADTVFNAVFTPDVHTVIFMAGETEVTTITVLYGNTITAIPEWPEGYTGWDFDFDTVITGDITINAIDPTAPYRDGGGFELAWTIAIILAIVLVVFILYFIKYEKEKKNKNKGQ
jgi:hypothetical protein